MAQMPVLVQANASFFLHPLTASLALRMLRNDQIQLLGSDCHNLKDRKPNIAAAKAVIEKRLGKEVLQRMEEYETQLKLNDQ